jgi:Protein of unknown function (DUF4038)/Putative collagen-binding domain of a collagenase/IPT/TIG domain
MNSGWATKVLILFATAFITSNLLAPLLPSAYGQSTGATAAITLAQHRGVDAGTSTSGSLAFNSSNTAGNWIAVSIRGGLSSSQIFTVRDSIGNTYKRAVQVGFTASAVTLAIFYAENIKGGVNTVTVSDTVSGPLRFAIMEYYGLAISNSLDAAAVATGTSASPNSGNLATTANGDLLLSAIATTNIGTFRAGTGYTLRDFVPVEPNTKLITEDQIQGAAGSATATASLAAVENWGAGLAAFKAAGGTGSTAPSITSLSPVSGPVGTPVTIAGTNFGATQGTSTVKFNGTAATATSWRTTSIVAPVPAGATTGNVVVTVGGVASNGVLFTVSTAAAKWPIKISANKRYFVDQNGTPWMMVADAAHHLMPAIPQSSVAQYLNDRVANGFNTINLYGACAGSGTCPASGAAFNGVLPFTVGTSNLTYDLSTPKLAYWSQVDSVIQQAANLGLVVLFEPLPWGVNFGTAMENTAGPINYPTNDFNFGVFLGTRYKNFPNIIWQFGQDFRGSALPSATFMDYMAQVMAGVASVDPTHLITCQLNYYRSYSQQGIPIGNSSYNSTLNTSFAYTYYETYDYVLAAYNASPTMPVFLGESNYETANNTGQLSSSANAFITRLEMWWTMTSGGAGHEFGNEHVNHFDTTSPTWRSQLDTTATLQVKYLTNLFNQFQWWMLVPDQSHQVVTAGFGNYSVTNENLYSATYATTAWNPNGTLAITYTPVSTTLSVNMANFSKPMTASWYDPTTGISTAIAGSPFAHSGSQSFTTPSTAHSDGKHDWVLVLQ